MSTQEFFDVAIAHEHLLDEAPVLPDQTTDAVFTTLTEGFARWKAPTRTAHDDLRLRNGPPSVRKADFAARLPEKIRKVT